MFKWEHSLFEGNELFPRTIQAPPILRVQIHPPPARPDYDYSKANLEQLGQQLLDKRRGQIVQFSQAQRAAARRSGLPIYRTHQTFPGVFVMYTLNHGTEQLDVTLYPVPPIKKAEDDLCLLVFHDTNKVTAVMMKELEVAEVQGLTAKLTRELSSSSWGEDLLKTSQYLLDTNDGGVAMSPIKIENNRVSRSETHCFVSVKDKFVRFFDTSTLARRTPHMNGGNKQYFTANDRFEFTASGLQYVGGYGGGGAPCAISAEGVYYYRPNLYGEWALWMGSADYAENLPENSPVTDATADAQKLTWDVPSTKQFLHIGTHIFNTSGETAGALGGITYVAGATWGVQASEGFGGVTLWDLLGNPLAAGTLYPNKVIALSGYASWADEEMAYTVETASYTSTGGVGVPGEPLDQDISTTIPMSVFSQADGVDLLSVSGVPLTVDYQWIQTDDGMIEYDTVSNSVAFLDYTFDRNYTSPTSAFTGANSPSYPLTTNAYPSGTDIQVSQAWFVTFPPSKGTATSTYYFAHDGALLTPYGEFEFTPSGPNARHILNMEGVYTPWFHLSNGKTYLQAFQVGEDRHIFCKGVEITQMLADAAGTTVSNIQGCLADFPLAKVRELA